MKTRIAIIIIVILIVLGNIIYFSPGKMTLSDTKPTTIPLPKADNAQTSKLKIEDEQVGTGQEVKSGDTVVMKYRGTLTDGTEFDSSDTHGPLTTQIGVGQVIKGWDQGIPGMKVGGKRKLTIPPDLAYGVEGMPPKIPPNATLVFEVELLKIQ